ncbi:MAG: heme-binding protein, partial [Aurantimicrobium sp.]|nr:heme-binding protein [Aurantimicrobium sp.]
MTERQPYTVVEKCNGYEIRDYPESRLAQVDMRANFSSAGSMGFGPLIRYISGGNASAQRIAMTAPVLQQASPKETYLVSFVMPAEMTEATMPQPVDGRVTMVTVPAR